MYDGSSPVKSEGRASAKAIDYWVAANAGRVMKRNGITDWKVPAVGLYYIEFGELTGLNHDLMVAQAAKETAYFTSLIFRDKLNPAGIGAVNAAPYEGAITFDTVKEGIRAQFAHMLSYVEGDGHILRGYSVRHEVLRSVGYLGVVAVLTDLNQRWAWSPPDVYNSTPDHLRYGQSISSWANQLIAVHDDKQKGKPVDEIELPYHKDIGKKLRKDGPFADYWRYLVSKIGFTEALMLIGFPITDEFEVDGIKMQYTERARLEHHPDAFPEHFDVLLGHLGREDVKLKDEEKERLEKIKKIQDILDQLR